MDKPKSKLFHLLTVWFLASHFTALWPSFFIYKSKKYYSLVTSRFGLGVQNEAGQRLIEFCQENALVIANIFFQQHKKRLYIWTSPDSQHQNQFNYILYSQRWRTSMQSTKTRIEADCGSDHELRIAKFRLNLKKVGKTARPFRYT